MFESLESRRLMSVVLQANGVLDAVATSGADAVSATMTSATDLRVTVNGHVHDFAASAIKGVEIHLGAGADVCQTISVIPTTVFGGAGDDHITDSGDGGNVLWGGPGDDVIDVANTGNDVVHGGAGNDSITGADMRGPIPFVSLVMVISTTARSSTLIGGAGNDTILAGTGGDVLFGDAGNDSLRGGADTDIIFGGAGNDTIIADSSDRVLGGPGTNNITLAVTPPPTIIDPPTPILPIWELPLVVSK